jgi:hypothetical protein
MSIRRLAALAAVAAISLLALGSASASATTALRTVPGGALLTGNTIRNAGSGPAVLTTGAGTLTCQQTLVDVDVNTNTSATSITGKLTSVTSTSCTDTILAVNITSCRLHPPSVPTVTIVAGAGGGTVTLTDPVIRCVTTGSGACYYTASSAVGQFSNATGTITFTNVPYAGIGVAGTSPTTDAIAAANCGGNGFYSAELRHIEGSGGLTVTVTTS